MATQPMRSGVGMDLGIVIALKEEFREFMKLLPVQPTPERDPATGQYGYVFEHPVSRRRCVVTLIGEMNPEPAALQTERLLSYWAPRAVVMLGIAAGIHPDVRVGDVVIASQVDNYFATAKAQGGTTPGSFEFSLGGTVFHADYNLLTQVRNFEFFAREVFARWQQDCAQVLAELVSEEEVRTALLQKGLVRAAPDLLDAHLASDSVVGAAQQFTQWLRSKRDRNLKALDMESAGLMAAAVRRMEPARTLIIRGISDYGDERKSDLDAVREGALRRYAMRNATRLLWALLEAGVMSEAARAGIQQSPASTQPEGYRLERGDGVSQAPFIGIPGGSLREGFKGREQALGHLHALLRETGKVALTSGTVGPVYAHGGGGMGKSRLAIEYAHRYRQEYPGGVFFAYVGERAPQALFAEFARRLLAEKVPSNEDEAALAFVRELGDAAKGPRLIIFDDVQTASRGELARRFSDPAELHGHPLWPIPYAHVSLLITTRMREIEREIEGAKSFSVERLDPDAALELLLDRARPRAFSLAEHSEARHLASEELGGHPLAIKLAGAYLGRVTQLSLAEYLKRIREQGLINKLEAARDEVGYTIRDHNQSIAATYELSWRQLNPEKPVDALALRLLGLAALLAHGTLIDPELLQRLARASGMPADLEQLGRALARLVKDLSLLDAAGRDVIIHPLIASYTIWRMSEQEKRDVQNILLAELSSLFPDSAEELWKITEINSHSHWEYLSPAREAHVTALWKAAGSIQSRERIVLSWCLGGLYRQRGDLSGALDAYGQALAIAERLVEREPAAIQWKRDLSASLGMLGNVKRDCGDRVGARQSFEKALDIAQLLAVGAPGNLDLQRLWLVSLNNYGDELRDQQDLRGARRAYEQGLGIAHQLVGQDPKSARWRRDLALGLKRLASVQEAERDWEGALRSYEQALSIADELVREEPGDAQCLRDVAIIAHGLGRVQGVAGNPKGERSSHKLALDIMERLARRAPEDLRRQWDVVACLKNLGDVLREQEDVDEARHCYERAFDMAKQLVAKWPANAEWQSGMASILCGLGDFQSMQRGYPWRQYYHEALDIQKRLVDDDPGNAKWQKALISFQVRFAVRLMRVDAAGHAEARSLLEQARSMLIELTRSEHVSDPQLHDWKADIEAMLREFNDLGSQEN